MKPQIKKVHSNLYLHTVKQKSKVMTYKLTASDIRELETIGFRFVTK